MNPWGHNTLQLIGNTCFAIYLSHEALEEDDIKLKHTKMSTYNEHCNIFHHM